MQTIVSGKGKTRKHLRVKLSEIFAAAHGAYTVSGFAPAGSVGGDLMSFFADRQHDPLVEALVGALAAWSPERAREVDSRL